MNLKNIKFRSPFSVLLLGLVFIVGCGPAEPTVEIEERTVMLDEYRERANEKEKETQEKKESGQNAEQLVSSTEKEEAVLVQISDIPAEIEEKQNKVLEESASKEGDSYYEELLAQCDPDSSCCKTSANKMKELGVKLAENGECPDGLSPEKNHCYTSYLWCE